MGNYNGTIRCGYCYNEGHNSRTCPQKLERVKRRYDNAKESGEHVEYYASQVARMTGENPETGAKRSRRNESWGRKCSYCGANGHNRRTCETLKNDLARYTAMTREARREVRQWALEDGIGVGAMVQYKESYAPEPVTMLVEALNIQHTHARQRHYNATLRPITGIGRTMTVTVQSDANRNPAEPSRYQNSLTVLGKLTPEQMAAQLPESWVDECPDWKNPPESLRNSVFDKGESRVYHFWHEIDEREQEAAGE